jgi:hypothetical protein
MEDEKYSEKQYIFTNIKIISNKIKEYEKSKNYPIAIESINDIISILKEYITKNKANITQVEQFSFNTLIDSYTHKLKSYDYLKYVDDKKKLINEKSFDKYLKKKKTDDYTENTSIIDYEVIPSNKIIDALNQIIELCNNLVRYYNEYETENKTDNFKQIQQSSMESYYVYERQNITNEMSNNTMENHIEDINNLKKDCEKLIKMYDTSMAHYHNFKLKDMNNQISIIKEEFNKIYPKYRNLVSVCERNNLMNSKTENKK